MQLSDDVRSDRASPLATRLGAAPLLRLYTGTPPANCAAAATGILLAEIELPADPFTSSAAGLAMDGEWTGVGIADGTAGYFRLVIAAGTTCHAQGTVSATGGGGELTAASVAVAVDQPVEATSFFVAEPNA